MEKQNNKKLWIVMLVLIALVAIVLVLQTQIYVMIQDLKTTIFGSYVMDANPFPPARTWLFDSNPIPPAIIK
ncbi:hypothetical protein JW911_02480 [Candidatus Peregrinibacteria bacterium]|nr:hypothetical protein [Candidatus Peregrinibacteria bacterium]